MKRDFRYHSFGLDIASPFALAELDDGTAPVSGTALTIAHAEIAAPNPPLPAFRHFATGPGGDLLCFDGVGRFSLPTPDRIDVDLAPGFDMRLIGLPLLGPVMALALHRRGVLVLHGSAVLIGGQAHVFLGDKGSGKSTTAAALVAAGFPLLSDDVIAIERTANGALLLHPGYAAMKLEAAMLADFPAGSWSIIEPRDGPYTAGKWRVKLVRKQIDGPVPLGTVHCLARGTANAIMPLSSAQTLHALIRFSHHPRLGDAANTPSEAATLFARAAQYAPALTATILTVKHSLSELSALGHFLESGDNHARIAA